MLFVSRFLPTQVVLCLHATWKESNLGQKQKQTPQTFRPFAEFTNDFDGSTDKNFAFMIFDSASTVKHWQKVTCGV